MHLTKGTSTPGSKSEKLEKYVFFAQTDTIVGFVSQNAERLTQIKQRPPCKHYIKAVNSFKTLTSFTRVPTLHKNRVRRMKHTTFIMPNGHSYRVVQDPHHLLLLERLEWAYTTSANLSFKAYDEIFAKDAADIIVEPLQEYTIPSRILKLRQTTIKKVR